MDRNEEQDDQDQENGIENDNVPDRIVQQRTHMRSALYRQMKMARVYDATHAYLLRRKMRRTPNSGR